jgi:hypothetical protein
MTDKNRILHSEENLLPIVVEALVNVAKSQAELNEVVRNIYTSIDDKIPDEHKEILDKIDAYQRKIDDLREELLPKLDWDKLVEAQDKIKSERKDRWLKLVWDFVIGDKFWKIVFIGFLCLYYGPDIVLKLFGVVPLP